MFTRWCFQQIFKQTLCTQFFVLREGRRGNVWRCWNYWSWNSTAQVGIWTLPKKIVQNLLFGTSFIHCWLRWFVLAVLWGEEKCKYLGGPLADIWYVVAFWNCNTVSKLVGSLFTNTHCLTKKKILPCICLLNCLMPSFFSQSFLVWLPCFKPNLNIRRWTI